MATGGITYPNTGSNGDGYEFAKYFNHKVIPPKSALAPIFIIDYPFKDLSGISFKNTEVKILNENHKKIASLKGDLLLTHKNFSGPVILNLSRYAQKGYYLQINFISLKKEIVKNDFLNPQINEFKIKKYIKNSYGLPFNFISKILNISGIDENIRIAELSKKKRNILISNLTEFKGKILKISKNGMVTNGGIALEEINLKTLESKIIKNLYFAGEVIDIDGNTGGYNIQFAISSGFTVAKSLKFQI
jgi:predicted Rossmann fold flavoprotein